MRARTAVDALGPAVTTCLIGARVVGDRRRPAVELLVVRPLDRLPQLVAGLGGGGRLRRSVAVRAGRERDDQRGGAEPSASTWSKV
jgi:hypothetical protein